MFIKLLTIITALFVGGGVKAPPTLHKQKQTNTIKETYVQRGNYDWQFYNVFDPNQDITSHLGFDYYIDGDNSIVLHNVKTSGERYLNISCNFVDGNAYFVNWKIETDIPNYSVGCQFEGFSNNIYDCPFVERYWEGDNPPIFKFTIFDYNGSAPELFLYVNIIDLTANPIPYFDTMIDLWTEKGVEEEVNSAIENTKNTNYPLYSMKFNYVVSSTDIANDIPLIFRGDDYTHIYKSDLYNAINSRVGSVSNNFTINIWLPIKNMRDLNIYAKGNNIKLLTNNNQIVYSYTQGNTIFELDLPNKNEEFSYIELSFYDFNSIGANDVILSVSNSVDFNSYQNGFDEGKKVGYEEGSKDGYIEGKENGIQQGEEQGFNKGFDKGYDKGLSDGALNKGFNPFTLVSTAFDSVSKLLSVNIIGGITIATLISIPLIFIVVLFILRLIKG